MSLLSLLHHQEEAGRLKPGVLEFAGAADSSGYLLPERGLAVHDVISAKRADGLCSLKGYLPGGTSLELVRSCDAELVIDCTPTNYSDGEPTTSCIRAAAERRRHYVTASKGAMALHMTELLELSRNHGTCLRFGATVGGGTPFLDFGRDCLYPQRVKALRGVLNGTTNFVLNSMEAGKSMQSSLAEATELGYAETDPSNDISGFDTAAKLVILVNWIMGRHITLGDVDITGISGITSEDVIAAGKHGNVIRLIGSFGDRAIVRPEQIRRDDVLNVKGSLNALTYDTEQAGPVTLTGQGAGGDSTAQAILRDILSILRETRSSESGLYE